MNNIRHADVMKHFLPAMRPQLIVYAGTSFLFVLVYVLGRLPISLLLYSLELSAFLFLMYLAFQYVRYVRRYRTITQLQQADLPRLDDLPVTANPADRLYVDKIADLLTERRELEKRYMEKEADQLDYFTLWLHQIKTPIAAISLLRQRLTDHEHESKQIAKELLRLEDYTGMALNYLKLEADGGDLDLAEVALDEVIKKAVRKYSILFIYNGIRLDYEPLGVKVLSDGRWLGVLIEQLLSNSLKYTDAGTVKIYMEPEETLVIEDSGIGIRPEDLPKVFNKGYSGLNGRLNEKSSGLGLYLSRRICRRLGHDLSIESAVGKGTKVRIRLGREEVSRFD
ncbi:sensor histidine kinase [Indiicoccus explosivorum]|uniref:sensor histidine kinase n=1 Tax=Indiicoccus explosivorum TaxID=1917864 RepID=UPI0015881725|nr:sensor histidine kinase [Indiicoccus explosivorum]